MTTRTRAWPATSHHWHILYDGMDWGTDAACSRAYPEIFFPHDSTIPSEARTYCNRCPVTEACLEYALAHAVHGVWGGTTEQERKQIRRDRKKAEREAS